MRKYIKDILNLFDSNPSDELIILLFYKNNKMNNNLLRIKWIETHNNIKEYLIHRYTEFNTYLETIYRIKNNISIVPTCLCKGCNNAVTFNIRYKGYTKHCSLKCAANDKSVRDLAKETNIKKYGVPYVSLNTLIYDKVKRTNLEKYGVPCSFLSKQVREHYNNVIKNKYNVLWPAQNKSIYAKVINTKKLKGTLTTSSLELGVYNYLVNIYGETNIKRLYKSILYPFFCDFYIVPILLYIEVLGHWSHGKHPFNMYNDDDNNIKHIWEEKSKTSLYYKHALNIWTVRDIQKRSIAKNNNLNFLEIFADNIGDCIDIINEKLKTLNNYGRNECNAAL